MPLRRVKGKLLKGNAMGKHPVLRRHLPETYRLKTHVFKRMIKRYPTVFIKPDKGSQGKGIVRLQHCSNREIKISWNLQHMKVKERSAWQELKKRLRPKTTYLIQQGLPLAKYKHRRIDVRVYMQKPKSKWLISGKVVRVGAPGRFVTNYHQGGQPKTIESVMNSIAKNQREEVKRAIRYLEEISLIAAEVLDQNFPGIRQLGMDIAVDRNGRIWIIEANTNPGFLLFKKLKDKTMYHRIVGRRRYIFSKYR
ncbi:YheC/YheD family protein [Effusibacillus dendaii]|uniref:ATP-grasp domain-containing protein n=1 Tax=Effusibacillus dendaii TaxID=2743772 RepID=A0A7I8DAX6_9BACL|nr:YheC/YheD family protein [Effusibacillus dendaii]BCJ85986.1 hypothetical protein skT53_09710 [Effusibacillus dendaii]